MNRYIIGLSAIMLILIAGCIQTPEVGLANGAQSTGSTSGSSAVSDCRVVYVEEPYTVEECRNITYTERVCQEKELEYTAGPIEKTDLCTADGGCTGKELLGECLYQCSGAMKRCRMNITNNDPKLTGTWVVGATFSYGGAAFVKNPQTLIIKPGETRTFDFEQLYQLDQKYNIASCSVYVMHPTLADECIDVVNTDRVCENVTKTRIVQEEICD